MQPSLRKAFGEDIANDLIVDYLKGEGSRFYMLYLHYKLLCEETNTFFSTEDFSEIMFGLANMPGLGSEAEIFGQSEKNNLQIRAIKLNILFFRRTQKVFPKTNSRIKKAKQYKIKKRCF